MTDRKEYLKRYRETHKAERAAYAREWRERNPDKVKEANHKQYLKRKGQTDSENWPD